MLGKIQSFRGSQAIIYSAIAVYIAMLVFMVIFGYYLVPYIILLFAFLLIMIYFHKLPFFKRVEKYPLLIKMLILFFLALFLRSLLLFQDQIITRDIVMYVYRSEYMMSGRVPYQDFAVNKPPLYAYFLQFLGYIIGAGEIQFRAFFSIMDAALTVIIMYILMFKFNEQYSFKASFAYAICPLPIISIGLAGHYEPVVMLCVMLSLLCLIKDRYELSAFFLGIGFAFKFFPLVLLPFFAWHAREWSRRITYILVFSIPMILTIIPILYTSPDAFWAYMELQTYTWPAKKSFAFTFELLTGTNEILGLKFSFLFTVLFLGLIFLMFLTWAKKRFNATFWFRIVVISYAMYYGLITIASIKFYSLNFTSTDLSVLMGLVAVIYFPLVILALNKYWHHLVINIEKREEMFLLCAFSLIFLLLSSSQYNPWYILWFTPFILMLKSERPKLILLWLIFWSFEGVGLSLLPGFGFAF